MPSILSNDPVLRFLEEMLTARPMEWSGFEGCPLCGLPGHSPSERRRMLRELPMEVLEALAIRHWFCLESCLLGQRWISSPGVTES